MMQIPSRLRPGGLLAGALLLGTACINVTPPGVFFASQPPGARVVLDDVDSGYVTPCMIDLDDDRPHEVRLEFQGYQTRVFRVVPGKRVLVIPWAYAVSENVQFPLFAPTQDLFYPRRVDKNSVPGRVYVRLHPQGAD
jgi:hypothetical protein